MESRRADGTSCMAGAVRTDNRLLFAGLRAIAWNVRAPGRFEWDNRLRCQSRPMGGGRHAQSAPETHPSVCIRACSVAGPEMAAWPASAREGQPVETVENYAPTPGPAPLPAARIRTAAA